MRADLVIAQGVPALLRIRCRADPPDRIADVVGERVALAIMPS